MYLLSLVCVAAGMFAMLGAICDWDWFMNAPKVRVLVSIFSRNFARIFYGILGLGLVTYGVLEALSVAGVTQK